MSNLTTEIVEININLLENEIRTIILRLDDIKAEHIQRKGKKNKAARKRLNKRSNIFQNKLKLLRKNRDRFYEENKYKNSKSSKEYLKYKIFTFGTFYSNTTIVEYSRKNAIKKYLYFLKNKGKVLSHVGYLPGSYASNNIMGQGPYGPWVQIHGGELGTDAIVYNEILLNDMIDRGNIKLVIQNIEDGAVFTSYLDG